MQNFIFGRKKKEKASAEELSIVNTMDEDTRTPIGLIKVPVGAITYEHTLSEKFYKDIYKMFINQSDLLCDFVVWY